MNFREWASEETGYSVGGNISERKRGLIKCGYEEKIRYRLSQVVRGDTRVSSDPLANETGTLLPEEEKTSRDIHPSEQK
jgi:hypothetical protein